MNKTRKRQILVPLVILFLGMLIPTLPLIALSGGILIPTSIDQSGRD